MFVCCECCVLSGRGLCDELITRLEESYRLRCVVVCDLETSRMRRSWPALGFSAIRRKKKSKVFVAIRIKLAELLNVFSCSLVDKGVSEDHAAAVLNAQ